MNRSSSPLLLLGWLILAAFASAQDAPPSFSRQIQPLLSRYCFTCHGPDAGNREGELRLDERDEAVKDRDGYRVIAPGDPIKSELMLRITDDDSDLRMPPPETGKTLSADEIALLRQWIEGGAKYEKHWAFVAARRPQPAEVADKTWSERDIDRFVLKKLESADMKPSPRADRRSLIRRVSFDLTGLPPTRDEIAAFLAEDENSAWESLVDRLLTRPQYGEHMGRHWLDLVRFSDTNGLHHDHFRDMSSYRDWVIRSLNANLPYDEFIKQQLAGDLLPEASDDQLIASGFNRLHMIIDRGTRLPEESLARNVIDRVTVFGTAFMGLTVECAACHDHKYDPISQRDFYQLYAFFNNLDASPETGRRSGPDFRRGLQPPYRSFPDEQQTGALEALGAEVASAQAEVAVAKQELKEGKDEARKELQTALKEREEALRKAERSLDDLLVTIPAAMIMKERAELRPAHIFVRGDYATLGDRVTRDTPSFLPTLKAKGKVPSRLDLAEWLVSGSHPLTARVAVNRIWQQFFGVGIVKTSEDLGTQGEWPSHPELLDQLALMFVESGWDLKALVKDIVMSETYRQSSRASPAAFESDPENRLLARGSRFRLDAEVIRDQILASSGLLDPSMFGKSVKPPQPAGIWKAVTLPDSYPRIFEADRGKAIYRRSVYTFWKRGMPPPQMTILNAPSREYCTVRRERTNTPLQALLLLNETEYLKAARQLASRILVDATLASETEKLHAIYEIITSRLPDEAESETLLTSLSDLRAIYEKNAKLAAELRDRTDSGDEAGAAELASWTVLVSTIYNLDITRTRE